MYLFTQLIFLIFNRISVHFFLFHSYPQITVQLGQFVDVPLLFLHLQPHLHYILLQLLDDQSLVVQLVGQLVYLTLLHFNQILFLIFQYLHLVQLRFDFLVLIGG